MNNAEVCTVCNKRPGVKTNDKGELKCLRCSRGVVDPIKNTGPKLTRNGKCPCGSGKKYKMCHLPIVKSVKNLNSGHLSKT